MNKEVSTNKLVTEIVMDALKRNGIPVVTVSEKQAQQFVADSKNRQKADFRLLDGQMFYSNAHRALEQVRQQKATPQQWLAMLANNGGIKAGEDKWSGLSEWLGKQPPVALDKEDILRYLDNNGITLHEEQFEKLEKTVQFQKMQQEIGEIIEGIDDRYREADEELERFYASMVEAYGEDYEYEMNDEEVIKEAELQEERSFWDNMQYLKTDEIAERCMEKKYGYCFPEVFFIKNGKLMPYEREAAINFLQEWVIDEDRLPYTTQKLDNYHELAVWAEGIKPWHQGDAIHFGEVGQGQCIGWIRFGDTVNERPYSAEEIKQRIEAMPKKQEWQKTRGVGIYKDADIYYPPGYDFLKPTEYIIKRKEEDSFVFQPLRGSGYICLTLDDAVRMYNERNVPRSEKTRILVIDEIQSDRHQQGKKNGYCMTDKEQETFRQNLASLLQQKQDYENSLKEKYQSETFSLYATQEELAGQAAYSNRISEMYGIMLAENKKVEPAPLEKNWHEFLMKRMLRYAADNGYDKLAWTKGEQQVQRYNVEKYIDKIEIQTQKENGQEQKCIDVVYKKEGHSAMFVNEVGVISGADGVMKPANGKKVSDVFGKSLGEKIMQTQWGSIDGENLNVTGEPMKRFYDNILPTFMNSYGKKWGVKVHSYPMPHLDEANRFMDEPFAMHAVDVTEEMKRSVMQGQPMFLKDKKGQVYGWTMDGTIYLTPKGLNAETGIHEYTHLWAEAMRLANPQGWEHIKSLLFRTPVWAEVEKDPNYRHLKGDKDRLANEVLARISGKDNTEKLEQSVRQARLRDSSLRGLQQIKQALGQFWSWVGKHIFHIRQARNVSDVTDRILGDLLRGTKPERARPEERISDIQIKMFGEKPFQVPRIRCSVDGEKQMFVDMKKKELQALQKETNPEKREQMVQAIAIRYFADKLQPQQNKQLKL